MIKYIKSIAAGLIAFLGGLVVFEWFKNKSAEGLLENLATKEKLNELDKDINKNEAELDKESEVRKQLKQDIEENKHDLELKELKDFFNRNKS